MKLRVYLDTTVISAAEDFRAPDRREQTLAFFDRADEFELMTSELTRLELDATPDSDRRARLLQRIATLRTVSINSETRFLASDYVR
jgi:predicted nucleic acid-binding protein